MYKRQERSLSETAEKRLEAIREFTEFGAADLYALDTTELPNTDDPVSYTHLRSPSQVGYRSSAWWAVTSPTT